MILAIGCNRGQRSTNNSAATPEVSNNLAADRSQARTLVDQGKELYRNDQDEEAVRVFMEAVRLEQEEAEKEYKKAVETYKKYLAESPDDAEAHYALGQTYAGLSQYSEAIREYREATKRKEDDPGMFYDLGVAHTKLAQYDAAAAAFSKSLELDPDYYRAQDGLDEAKEGIKRIRAGRKHNEDLLKKQQKEEELKKAGGTPSPSPED
jgi:Flp pilus assembly protein TadD